MGKYKLDIRTYNDPNGTIVRIKNTLNKYPDVQTDLINKLEKSKKDFISANNTFGLPWNKKDVLKETKENLMKIEKDLYAVSISETTEKNKVLETVER